MNYWTQSANNIFVAAHRGWKDKCIEMGTELITCNNPDEVLEILRKKNLHR